MSSQKRLLAQAETDESAADLGTLDLAMEASQPCPKVRKGVDETAKLASARKGRLVIRSWGAILSIFPATGTWATE